MIILDKRYSPKLKRQVCCEVVEPHEMTPEEIERVKMFIASLCELYAMICKTSTKVG
jgi:hypothetical protein